MKNSDFSLNTYSLGIERAKIQQREKLIAKAQRHSGEIASRRYRGHPPCRKVVRLARVPYYARPRLTPFLSAHVSLGSGSIRRALTDVSPSLGIKLANGRKKWSHDNARSFPVEVYSLAPPVQPSQSSRRQPLGPHDSPHFHVAITLGCWHFYFHETCIPVVVVVDIIVYTRLLTANDGATLNKDCAYTQSTMLFNLTVYICYSHGFQTAGEKKIYMTDNVEIYEYMFISFVVHSMYWWKTKHKFDVP